MQLHTYPARSLPEALRLVREELGPDASVLHTREVGSPLLALARRTDDRGHRLGRSGAALPAGCRRPVSAARRVPAGGAAGLSRCEFATACLPIATPRTSLVEQLASQCRPAAPMRADVRRRAEVDRWTSAGVGQQTRRALAAAAKRGAGVRSRMPTPIASASRLQAHRRSRPARSRADPARRRHGPTVVALVGPTGVGKTTTIAKLAAHFRLRRAAQRGR